MVRKTAEQWARINARREQGLGVRGAPSARVAQKNAAQMAAKAKRGRRA